MSLRASTTSLIPGKLVASLYPGLGATGAQITAASAAGTGGSGPLLDAGLLGTSEYLWYVVTAPTAGTLTLRELGQFTYVPGPTGAYSFTYGLKQDGVYQGQGFVSLGVLSAVASFLTTGVQLAVTPHADVMFVQIQ